MWMETNPAISKTQNPVLNKERGLSYKGFVLNTFLLHCSHFKENKC